MAEDDVLVGGECREALRADVQIAVAALAKMPRRQPNGAAASSFAS